MTRHRFSCERAGRILTALAVSSATVLGLLHHRLWFLVVAGTALNLLVSGIADRCMVRNALVRMGFPRERDLGRTDGVVEGTRRELPASARRHRLCRTANWTGAGRN